jgi:PD-(D/E)XK nuclease superfamily
MENDRITQKIIGAAIEVHRTLGPGLLLDVSRAQILSYVKATGLKRGLLINFGAKMLGEGIK